MPGPLRAPQLTDDELEVAVQMVNSGATASELSERFPAIKPRRWTDWHGAANGRSRAPHEDFFRRVERRQGKGGGPRVGSTEDERDPTPAEIETACEEIRSHWTIEDHIRRQGLQPGLNSMWGRGCSPSKVYPTPRRDKRW